MTDIIQNLNPPPLGQLFVVATPIGNLEDMTLRGLRVLREADWIACEDTRQTRKLLDHFGIQRSTVSYHDHNEAARAAELVGRIVAGQKGALVSDAGTPLISDPGYRLVEAAIAAGITVVPVPGASAALGALMAAGLPTDTFRFCGFLPAKSGQRKKLLEELRGETCTLIFYEAPHRVLHALEDITEVLGARRIVAARELTKMHEEILRGTAEEVGHILAARASVRGEFTLLIDKASEVENVSDGTVTDAVEAAERAGMSRMDAIKQVARERGLAKRDVYREVVGE